MRHSTMIGICAAALIAASSVHATSGYKASFETAYPAAIGSRIDACSLCHTSAPARNSYGAAFAGAGFNFKAIESADSDGDGFTNLQEITALTFPGNAADNPNSVSNTQPGGCAGPNCQKGAFSFDGITKALGDLFIGWLGLIALMITAQRKL